MPAFIRKVPTTYCSCSTFSITTMVAYIFYILFFASSFLNALASDAALCAAVKCSHDGPDIRFPFRVKGQQPQRCGLPGFELSCQGNTTTIPFPNYKNMVVKSISYKDKKVSLLDPQSCVHEVFLHLNLSFTPFQYYYVVRNYTYLNCSTRLPPSFVEVQCLSGSRHHVYTVKPSLETPVACKPVKTVAIPFAYSPYLADNGFGLGLTWSLPPCEDCEDRGGQSKTELETERLNIAQGFSMKRVILGEIRKLWFEVVFCVLAVTTLISIQMYHSKERVKQTGGRNLLLVAQEQ